MSTNRSSLSSADDIQAMLDNVSDSTESPFASARTSRPGELLSVSLSQGGMDLSSGLVSLPTGGTSSTRSDVKITESLKIEGKPLPLYYLSQECVDEVCCGLIGSHKGIFCLKLKAECSIHQKGGSHFTSKFAPQGNTYYVCKSVDKTSAYCNLAFSHKSFIVSSIKHIDLSVPKPIGQWRALIQTIHDEPSPVPGEDLEVKPELDLKPPALATDLKLETIKDGNESPNTSSDYKREYHVKSFPNHSFKPSQTSAFKELDTMEESVLKSILKTHHSDINFITKYLNELIQKWNVLDQDLVLLNSKVATLHQELGSNTQATFLSAWNAIDVISKNLEGIDFEDLQTSVNLSTMQIVEAKESISKFKSYWETLAEVWLPKIVETEQNLSKLKSNFHQQTASNESSKRDKMLDSLLHPSESSLFTHQPSDSHMQNSNLLITSLKERLDALESSQQDLNSRLTDLSAQSSSFSHQNIPQGTLGVSGVQYRQYFFKDPDDVESWMRSSMTHPSHGLFVDLVSFSEFFGADVYVDRNTTLNEVYMSSKIGYASVADSIVASSFQNVLPTAYGKPLTTSKITNLKFLHKLSSQDFHPSRNGTIEMEEMVGDFG